MDTVEQMQREVTSAKPTWRENDRRLIWFGLERGEYVFHNTTEATRSGPKISAAEAARILASEGPWRRPSRA